MTNSDMSGHVIKTSEVDVKKGTMTVEELTPEWSDDALMKKTESALYDIFSKYRNER